MTPDEVLVLARAGDMATLSANVESVSAAVHAFVRAGDGEPALELVGRAWRVWTSTGKVDDGAAAAAAALDAPARGASVWRARALYADGVIAFRAGDESRSRARNEELLAVARAAADARGECDGLTGLARLALRAGEYREVVRLARDARALAAKAGDVSAAAAPLHLEAAGVRLQQRYDEARDLYLQSLELNTRLGNVAVVAMEDHNLGWVELHRDDLAAAEDWFGKRDAASAADPYGDAWSDLNWAAVAAVRHDWDEARRLFDKGVRALDGLGVKLDPDDAFERAWLESQMAERAC